MVKSFDSATASAGEGSYIVAHFDQRITFLVKKPQKDHAGGLETTMAHY